MSAAQPSLTLVRPRRTGASAPSTETHSIPTTAPAPTPAAPVRSGDTPQSGHPAQTGHTTRSGHPVQSGRTTQSSGAASAEAATATSQPLDPQDRQLLESMSPALATALVEVLVGSRAATSIEKWVEVPLFARILEHVRVRESLSQRNPHTDRPRSTSVPRLCEVSDSVVEIALVVTTTRRPRALALRLTRRRSRWRLSDFVSI